MANSLGYDRPIFIKGVALDIAAQISKNQISYKHGNEKDYQFELSREELVGVSFPFEVYDDLKDLDV